MIQALSVQALGVIVAEAEGALTAIQQSVQLQEGLLSAIMVENAAFTAFRLSDPTTAERDRVLRGIEDSASKVLRLHSQLTSGNTFYSNLQVQDSWLFSLATLCVMNDQHSIPLALWRLDTDRLSSTVANN